MGSFRQSRVALILDLALLPLGVVIGILRGGVPDVVRELMDYPRSFKTHWNETGWFSTKAHNTEDEAPK